MHDNHVHKKTNVCTHEGSHLRLQLPYEQHRSCLRRCHRRLTFNGRNTFSDASLQAISYRGLLNVA